MAVELVDVACPICDSTASRPYARYYTHLFGDTIIPMNLTRCVTCDLIFVNPRPPADEIEALYASDRFTADQNRETVGRGDLPEVPDDPLAEKAWLADKMWKVRKLERFAGGGRLLDVGCGFGAMMKAAEARGCWGTCGIDPSPAVVRFARDKWGLNVQCKSVFEMDFPSSHFDAVCMDNVLEHIDKPVACMRAVSRVLRPGGVVLIEVPYIRGFACRAWRIYLKVFPRDGHPNTYGHICFYTRKSLAVLLQKTGFQPRLTVTDQTTFLGESAGVERLLRRAAIAAGRTLPGAGNLLVTFAVRKSPRS